MCSKRKQSFTRALCLTLLYIDAYRGNPGSDDTNFPFFHALDYGAKTVKIEVRGLDETGFDYAIDGMQFKSLKQVEDVDSLDSFSSSEEINRPLHLDG